MLRHARLLNKDQHRRAPCRDAPRREVRKREAARGPGRGAEPCWSAQPGQHGAPLERHGDQRQRRNLLRQQAARQRPWKLHQGQCCPCHPWAVVLSDDAPEAASTPSALSQTMPLALQTSIHWPSSAAATQAWATVGASAAQHHRQHGKPCSEFGGERGTTTYLEFISARSTARPTRDRRPPLTSLEPQPTNRRPTCSNFAAFRPATTTTRSSSPCLKRVWPLKKNWPGWARPTRLPAHWARCRTSRPTPVRSANRP